MIEEPGEMKEDQEMGQCISKEKMKFRIRVRIVRILKKEETTQVIKLFEKIQRDIPEIEEDQLKTHIEYLIDRLELKKSEKFDGVIEYVK